MSYMEGALEYSASGSSSFRTRYTESSYEVVSKVAYLCGVPRRIFENENEPPQMSVFRQLELDKNARIIRHLCMIRTAIERSYKRINEQIMLEYRSIVTMPEYIPEGSVRQLAVDGVNYYKKSNVTLNQHLMEINRIITDRINNCKSIFPIWLNWNYVKKIFIMPNGLTEEGLKKAAEWYYQYMDRLPYQVYIHWPGRKEGNILYNDKTFVTRLYTQNGDVFDQKDKVSDAGDFIKDNIYNFVSDSDKIVMVVDCENSDPYRLCATLKGLEESIFCKVQKIMLFDDVNTIDAWRVLESYTTIPVEHIMTERVKWNKSLVDIELTARTCLEHYRNHVDAFIIVSSDSDYWGLISSLPEARFLVMIESEKCGPDMKAALARNKIFYCYIDDFYSGNSDEIRKNALILEIKRHLDRALQLNVNQMFDEALAATRVNMTPAEKEQFFDRHIRQMQLVLDEAGNASLKLKIK